MQLRCHGIRLLIFLHPFSYKKVASYLTKKKLTRKIGKHLPERCPSNKPDCVNGIETSSGTRGEGECSLHGSRFFGGDFAIVASGAYPVHPVRSANERGQYSGEP